MVDIVAICKKLDCELSKNFTQEDVLLSCVSDKLSSLYMAQSEKLDNIIDELTLSIDTGDVEYTYSVIRKLAKSLSSNRKQLISLIEEVSK